MTIHAVQPDYAPFSFQISSVTHPKTLEDLDTFHKDSVYELVSAAREAYIMKVLANKLASGVTKSSNVRDMANLIADSAREQERSLRMAACIANAPVSTTYPYLPVMPTKLSSPVSQVGNNLTAPAAPNAATPGSAPLPSALKQGFGGAEISIVCQTTLTRNRTHELGDFI